ncbi:G-type lectin S-receptor-like serine/threonine-protein kinase SD2-5 [Typha angustifolia]|uniref:G-type lectin S-receptor-like serine/threonine-protein kinase SD2-5 n=1 Tax=Typha angustifolia TaxID=59011 RepID=UPI003C2ED8CB
MLLFEIAGKWRNTLKEHGREPAVASKSVWEKFEVGKLRNIGEGDIENTEKTFKVDVWCVHYQAEARLPMSKVAKMLEGEMDIPTPPNPFKHMLAFGTALLPWSEGSKESSATKISSSTSDLEAKIQKN